MSVLTLLVILVILGAVLWAVNSYGAAMNKTIRIIINVVVIAIAIIITLSAFGVWNDIKSVNVPKL